MNARNQHSFADRLRFGDAFQARAAHEPSLASRPGLTVGIAIAGGAL